MPVDFTLKQEGDRFIFKPLTWGAKRWLEGNGFDDEVSVPTDRMAMVERAILAEGLRIEREETSRKT